MPFCTLFAGFGSTNKSATSLLLLSESRSVLFSIFSFTVISLADLAGSLLSLLLFHQATMGPRILGNDAADELARRRALLVPSVIPCSLSSFISRIHSFLFFFGLEVYCLIEILQHTGFLVLHRGTCAPLSRSLCSLSSTLQRTQPSVKLLSLWDCQNLESFLQRLRTPSQNTSNLTLHCPATESLRHSLSGDSQSLYDFCSRPWVVAWLLRLHGFLPCSHPSEGVRLKQQQQ